MSRWQLIFLGAALPLALGCQKKDPGQLPAAVAEAPIARTIASAHPSGERPRPLPLELCRSQGEPLEAARRYYDAGQFEEALSCAAQAGAFFPMLPQAHSERGAALSALARFEEAQLAYARALALDPNHADSLLGAAHLYAVSLPSSRENDELAAVYAERGIVLARALADEDLQAQFALVAAMAYNDLGQASDALERAQAVLRIQRGHPDARYEQAVALFELCRFREARAVFRTLLDEPQRGAHAHHHLGLILEREGKLKEAERHFAIAQDRAPEDFPPPQPIGVEQFRAELSRAILELPEDMRRDLQGVPVTAEELPADEDLTGGDPPLSPTILGLFRGPPLGEPCAEAEPSPCRSVALYRRNLVRAVSSHQELLEQIRITLLHEVGHLRGEDDLELAARGLE
jgi:tetratricopeptide (TPR) repeat protein